MASSAFTKPDGTPDIELILPWTPAGAAARQKRLQEAAAAAATVPLSNTGPYQVPPHLASTTYAAGCHCGAVAFDVTLSPPLEEGHPVLLCNCSICRRTGYLLVYATRDKVQWRGGRSSSCGGGSSGEEGDAGGSSTRDGDGARCGVYQFNTREIDHLFCRYCGASLGIDFRNKFAEAFDGYGINVRAINNVDLDSLAIAKNDGKTRVPPAGDMSGQWYQPGDRGQ